MRLGAARHAVYRGESEATCRAMHRDTSNVDEAPTLSKSRNTPSVLARVLPTLYV